MNSPTATIDHMAQTRVEDCYQCGKCTAGCPVAHRMDMAPNQLMRLAQTGRLRRALKSEAIWLCVSCQTCSTRCPKSVDIAAVLDAMRQMSVEAAAAAPAQRRTVIFQKAFLRNIRRHGRLNEMELVGTFKTSAFFKDLNIPLLLKDAMLGPKMMQKGKLHLKGESVRDTGIVARIFERCMKDKAE